MIFVHRIDTPRVLRRNATRWLKQLQEAIANLEQIKSDPSSTAQQKKRAQHQVKLTREKYNHAEIKLALVQIFHGKCAYCESQIKVVDYGHIEHFYPKNYYVDQTFNWQNLLLSCAICNDGSHKGTNFPLSPDGTPLLLNPTNEFDDVSSHFLLSWDQKTYLACIYGNDERGKTVVDLFDLNGERGRKELVKERSQYIRQLLVLLEFALQGEAEALSILQDACSPNEKYSAFANKFIAPAVQTLAM
jgi:uncharacterized protein (TIGR02646 family)